MWVTPEQIAAAKEMDLLTYLQNYEPTNLKKVCAGTYCTREHDSLKISNGVWHWFSRHIGGKNALDYLIKVKGVSFTKAVEMLTGYAEGLPPVYVRQEQRPAETEFELPERNEDNNRVRRYLRLRGIDDTVIGYCLKQDLIYEDKKYHNCNFIGYKDGVPKYGAVRSTVSDYKIDLPGSDKRFSFSIPAEADSDTVHLFEAAIDLLSFASLEIKEKRIHMFCCFLEIFCFHETASLHQRRDIVLMQQICCAAKEICL